MHVYKTMPLLDFTENDYSFKNSNGIVFLVLSLSSPRRQGTPRPHKRDRLKTFDNFREFSPTEGMQTLFARGDGFAAIQMSLRP